LALANTGSTLAGVGMAAAAGLIMFLPNLIIFIVMQSRVMNTMAHAGIK
jgi:multiple sugar transport system permease protein